MRARWDTAFGKQFEPQRARNRCSLNQLYRDTVTKAMGLTAAAANHGMHGFFIAEIILAQAASRDEAIAYAARHGIAAHVEEPHDAKRRVMSYSDNFKSNRIGSWTH